ncbi:MAG: cysteine desulfurase [Candidatus Binatus sp.]
MPNSKGDNALAGIGKSLRPDFPILEQKIGRNSLVYLDNAATSQKPRVVTESLANFYQIANSNVHRSVHTLAERATDLYERAREKVAEFIGAEHPSEIIFVRNTTEAINLVAYAFARSRLAPGDEIVVTVLNHHSNLVPWQQAAAQSDAKVRAIPLTRDLQLDMRTAASIIGPRTKIVAITHKSNVTGTIVDVAALSRMARQVGAAVVIDAAQSVPHLPVDVHQLDCDFLAFSGHKMLGPMGIGVLYGRRELLEQMPPFMTGGEMVLEVELETATWNDIPLKFEAGTPNVAGAVALATAIDYLSAVGMQTIAEHEKVLADAAWKRLEKIEGIQCVKPSLGSNGIVSFSMTDIHPHDVATILDSEGVAVRAGHHCAQPLHKVLGVPATVRASFYLYNDHDDVDRLVDALRTARQFFHKRGRSREVPL